MIKQDEEKVTKNAKYYMKEIGVQLAKKMVMEYHYSGKVVQNSKLHLGVFDIQTDELVGALQYGYPMNPAKTPQRIVKGSSQHEMFELNRMAMRDDAPKFSESQAIGLSIKYIKRYMPHIKWLLSFSDGKEGNVGIIYQATNWEYRGYRLSTSFWDLDGDIEHSVKLWSRYKRKDTSGRTTTEIICDIFDNISKIEARQHIYVFPLDKKIEIIPEKQPYPKKESEPLIVRRVHYKKDGKVCNPKEVDLYDIPDA